MASEIKVDTISEKTSAGGVTIDGLLIKDGGISGDVALIGTTPTFTIGDAGAEDAALIYDGNAQDFYIALDDSADDLVIGLGSTVGTTPIMSFDENKDVAIPDGGLTITTSDNTDTLTLKSTDADATEGPNLILQRDSGSPADGDDIGRIDFDADNDAGEVTRFVTLRGNISDASNGSEDGQFLMQQMIAGSEVNTMRVKPDEIVFNDSSIDMDFRVETNNKAYGFFVDAGNDRIGMITAPDLGSGLHIRSDDSGASSVSANYDELVLENNGHCGMTILSGTSSAGAVRFGDSGDDDIGGVIYDHSDNSLTLKNNAANGLVIDSAGIITKPLQCAFKAVPASEQQDLAINGWRTIVWGTERFDTNADFSNSNLTAPVTGKYLLSVCLYLQNLDGAATSYTFEITTSNDDYPIWVIIPAQELGGNDTGYYAFNAAVLADMDAGDTAAVRVYPEGGTAQVDVNISSTYSGMLIG